MGSEKSQSYRGCQVDRSCCEAGGEVPGASILSYVLAERQALLEYGKRAADEPPDIHDLPSPVDLLSDARRRDWS
jgi:hypothetical protein